VSLSAKLCTVDALY